MDRERAGSQRAQALLHLFHVAVRIDPRVLCMQDRRGRRIIQLLQMTEIFRSVRLGSLVIRFEDVGPLIHLAWNHVRIVIGHIVDRFSFDLVAGLLIQRRYNHSVVFVAVTHHFGVSFHRLHRMVTAIQCQSYADDQDAHGCYSTGETRHQKTVVHAAVGSSAICGQKET